MVDEGVVEATAAGRRRWFLAGMRGIGTAPALILVTAHVGFAGLARDAGITAPEAGFMVATIWALPANIVLIGAATAGTSLAATALAIALSSLRLMPMVMALMPEMRGPRTRTGTLLALSHFVAITGWVFAMQNLRDVPRPYRTAFFAGFGGTLCAVNTVVVAAALNLMGQFPALVTGALAFLTPVYFLCSLYGSARESSGRLALFTGMAALPIANWITPELDILIAGVAGGIVAFLAGRAIDGRRAA